MHCEAGNRAVNWLDINFCKKEPLSRLTRLLVVKNRPKISGNVTFTKNFLRQEISWKRNVFSEYCQKFSILYSLFDLPYCQCKRHFCKHTSNTVYIYLFKINNRSTWKRCEICSKLTIKAPLGSITKAFLEKYGYLRVTLSSLKEIWTLIELTNTNKCSTLKFIIKCYFADYSLFSNF